MGKAKYSSMRSTDEIVSTLREMGDAEVKAGQSRFGIQAKDSVGIQIPKLRLFAKTLGKNHELALKLWKSGLHEARLIACYIDEPEKVTAKQMEAWAKDFDSWDICDQVCGDLFDKTTLAYDMAFEWSERKEEFVKRAGFALMAALAVHDKKAPNKKMEAFYPVIIREATDERNFVRKAVNWALRNIGKRNASLCKSAMSTAEKIRKIDSRAARWIASDALRELKQRKFD